MVTYYLSSVKPYIEYNYGLLNSDINLFFDSCESKSGLFGINVRETD